MRCEGFSAGAGSGAMQSSTEFLVERSFPWTLVRRVGVCSVEAYNGATVAMRSADHRPTVTILASGPYSASAIAAPIRSAAASVSAVPDMGVAQRHARPLVAEQTGDDR